MFAFDLVEAPRRGRDVASGLSRLDNKATFFLFICAAATALFVLATRVEAFFLF